MTEMQEVTLGSLATEAAGWFETRHRDGGERYDALKDGRPDWVYELVFYAHGDGSEAPRMLPDDHRYTLIRNALEFMSEGDIDPEDDDADHEFADGEVDVYTADRFAWLASHLERQGYVDEARREGFTGEDADIAEMIGTGQYMEAREVFELVRSRLVDRLAE